MKKTILLLLGLVMSMGLCATDTTYHINIDNAPNASASGTMKAYIPGFGSPIGSTTIKFEENYLGGRGGKYYSSTELLAGTESTPVTIKCSVRMPWGGYGVWLFGYKEETFTNPSMNQLPTMHIDIPPLPPVNPPEPDDFGE